jgi:hypothetical protein
MRDDMVMVLCMSFGRVGKVWIVLRISLTGVLCSARFIDI